MTGEVVYNTGNPVPSADAYDRHDNTRVFDALINGTEPTVTGRTGKILKSWEGFGQQWALFLESSGYEDLGEYAVGMVVTGRNQVFEHEGSLYRVSASLPLPFTSTGNWATESADFILVARNDNDLLSVRAFIFNQVDGTTDNQAGIVAAVAEAIATNSSLYWPAGTYVSSATIPGFHQVRHKGPGRLLRAGTTFYISPGPTQSNNLFLAPSGDDANDGLTATFPRLTLSGAGSALANFGPYLDGTWLVNLAAGQYNQTDFTFPPGLRGRNPVYFKGPVSVHPAAPTAILDGGGTGSFGVQLNRECTLYLVDLLIRNYQNYGIVGQDGCMLFGLRCHVVGVPNGPGVKMQQGRVNWIDGRAANCQQGFSFIAGCTFTIAASNPSLAAGTRIENNIQSGVQAQEQASGHVDFALVAGNPIGYRLVARSRVHSQMTRITGSVTAAVQLYGASDWYNNGSQLDANATAELMYTGSIEVVHYQNNVSPTRRPIDSAFVTHTGSTAATTLKTYADAFVANNFWNSTKSMRFVIAGEITGNGGNKNLVVKIDGVDSIGFTIPAAATGAYVIDGTITALAPTQQTFHATCSVNGQPVQVATGARAIPMNSGSTPVATVVCTLSSASDSLTLRAVALFET
jgi:hypothetical protein